MMAALVAAIAVLVAVTLPPSRLQLGAPSDGTIAGVLHVHTNRSDGLSGPDDIAAAAANAGLKFLAFADHGDGTRRPDPPQYRHGVLCFDGVEISTSGGHYVALDMPVAPYPLAGEPRDVVEDVRRLGGFGIAAHPDSPKPELAWREWSAPVDAVELLNPDTAWRQWVEAAKAPAGKWAARRRLAVALLDYPFRAPQVIAGLIQPTRALTSWERLTRHRRVVALGGIDAHAKIAPRNADPGDSRFALPFPGYAASFGVMSIHVRIERRLTGDAAADAPMVMRAIRAGHLYTAVDAVAAPPSFEFSASNEYGTVQEGAQLGAGSPVTLHVKTNAPPQFTTTIWKGSGVLTGGHHEPDFTAATTGEPAVYWVDITSTGTSNPLAWIRSNPIYVRGTEPLPTVLPAAPHPPATGGTEIFDRRSADGWRVEHDPGSDGVLDLTTATGGAELRFRWALGGGAPAGQVSALAFDTPSGVAGYDRLTIAGRADHPMRAAVQLRRRVEDAPDQRWQRSVYLDPVQQEHTIFFDDMAAVGEARSTRPDLANVRSILIVVDANNTKPTASGRIWIRRAALEK